MRDTPGVGGNASRWRVVLAGLVGLDALVVLLGTFFVWILLGLAEFEGDVPGWMSPAVVVLGVTTAALSVTLAVSTLRERPRAALGIAAVCLHLGLAVATAVALGSTVGVAVLMAGTLVHSTAAARDWRRAIRR